ncbi:MAG: imidazole glycerol phosphate synthase subunit HisH, partial [Methanomicrobiales archaeon]|nr:imidazole glycerol phosphate synthase subunit HisH [Methanomicrobiales archaeon]
GMGNLGSIVNTLRRMKNPSKITSNKGEIMNAERIIIPGVGSFARGMQNLYEKDLIEPLYEQIVDNGVPTLGICLGMQIFTTFSEEGNVPGLGWISGETIRFSIVKTDLPCRVPHMGWNSIIPVQQDPIFEGINADDRFYFVHSYHVSGIAEENVLAKTTYKYSFVSVIRKKNIWGIQCHPERSHSSGITFLSNFLKI